MNKRQKLYQAISKSVEIVDRLERLYNSTRGRGNTRLAAEAVARHQQATLVVYNEKHAQLLREHKHKALSLRDPKLSFIEGPAIVDMHAIFQLVCEYKRLQFAAMDALQETKPNDVDTKATY